MPAPDLTTEQVREVHELIHDAGPYSHLLSNIPEASDPGGMILGSAGMYMEEYLKQMAPRNNAERMLAVQMFLQHARISRLMTITPKNDLKVFTAVNAAIDSAMNTYRRQAATWDAIRSPRPVQFIKGEQVNLARQQVIAHGPVPSPQKENLSNEQGFANGKEAPLLPERLGPEVPAFLRPQEQALDPLDRAPLDTGQGEVVQECHQTRRAVRRNHGTP